MSGLQETFYIMGIVFMSLMFLMMIVLLSSVFIIRSKINNIHSMIDERIDNLLKIAERSGEISSIASSAIMTGAKKAFKKAKK